MKAFLERAGVVVATNPELLKYKVEPRSPPSAGRWK
jgi:hypothetical protein